MFSRFSVYLTIQRSRKTIEPEGNSATLRQALRPFDTSGQAGSGEPQGRLRASPDCSGSMILHFAIGFIANVQDLCRRLVYQASLQTVYNTLRAAATHLVRTKFCSTIVICPRT